MSKHHAIIELHHSGVYNSMIIKQLKVPKSTVYITVAKFKQLGDDKDLEVDALAQLIHSRSSRWLVRGSEGIQNDQSEKWLKSKY